MSEQCSGPDCENNAMSGPLCFTCEKKWMADRRDVLDEADHLTAMSAQFAAWCADHGQPNPYD